MKRDYIRIGHGYYDLKYCYVQCFRDMANIFKTEDIEENNRRADLFRSLMWRFFNAHSSADLVEMHIYPFHFRVSFMLRPTEKPKFFILAMKQTINSIFKDVLPEVSRLFMGGIFEDDYFLASTEKGSLLSDINIFLKETIRSKSASISRDYGSNKYQVIKTQTGMSEISLRYFIVLYFDQPNFLDSHKKYKFFRGILNTLFDPTKAWHGNRKYQLENVELLSSYVVLECYSSGGIEPAQIVKGIKVSTSKRVVKALFPEGTDITGIWGERYFISSVGLGVESQISKYLKMKQTQSIAVF